MKYHYKKQVSVNTVYLAGKILLSMKQYTVLRNIFISNTMLKLAKNQGKAKQDPEAELLLFENYSISPFMLSS